TAPRSRAQNPQTKTEIKLAAVMRAATGQTRNRASDATNARKIAPAIRTFVAKTTDALTDCKRQVVTAHFVTNSEIAASLPPFRAMRQNPPAPGAELCEQMRQFVAQCSIDLWDSVIGKSRIQGNQFSTKICAPGRGFHPRVPLDADLASERRRVKSAQE